MIHLSIVIINIIVSCLMFDTVKVIASIYILLWVQTLTTIIINEVLLWKTKNQELMK